MCTHTVVTESVKRKKSSIITISIDLKSLEWDILWQSHLYYTLFIFSAFYTKHVFRNPFPHCCNLSVNIRCLREEI